MEAENAHLEDLVYCKQAQTVLIWIVLREAFHGNPQGMFAGVCAGALESVGAVHSCTEPQDILTLKTQTMSF